MTGLQVRPSILFLFVLLFHLKIPLRISNEISKYHDKNLVNEDVEEKRRLFFVSATRARDELYIVSQRYAYGSKGNGKSIPDTRVQNIFLREAVWAVEQK